MSGLSLSTHLTYENKQTRDIFNLRNKHTKTRRARSRNSSGFFRPDGEVARLTASSRSSRRACRGWEGPGTPRSEGEGWRGGGGGYLVGALSPLHTIPYSQPACLFFFFCVPSFCGARGGCRPWPCDRYTHHTYSSTHMEQGCKRVFGVIRSMCMILDVGWGLDPQNNNNNKSIVMSVRTYV